MSNPFNMVYSELWNLAEANDSLTSLVQLRNRMRYDSDTNRDPEKRSLLDSDVPELSLISTGLSGNMWNTSSTSVCTRNYEWIIITGDLRITERLLPVEWELFKAMHTWKSILTALQWEGKSFVKRAALTNIQDGILRPDARQGVPRGWACVWGIEVEMHFSVGDLS